jgi:hypothetical protein
MSAAVCGTNANGNPDVAEPVIGRIRASCWLIRATLALPPKPASVGQVGMSGSCPEAAIAAMSDKRG